MPSYQQIREIHDNTERVRIVDRILALRAQLDRDIPAKTATETLLLATWNIRDFGNNRRGESLHYMAEIISRFDLVAVQEVARDLGGLKKLVDFLGHNWDYIVTDSTEGTSGGGERMAFIYDRCKVFFRKVAGELVLQQTRLIQDKLQFARTPFSVAFQAGWFKFMLTTVHMYYGSNVKEDPRRVAEIAAVARFLRERSLKEDENNILLGDFNIFKTSDKTMMAMINEGFYIPQAIREHPTDLGKTKYYDQIAFRLKLQSDMTVFSEGDQRAGAFNFAETVYTPQDLGAYRGFFDEKNTKDKTEEEVMKYYLSTWRTFQMSDHLPLWIELKVDFSNQYLKGIRWD